MSRPSSQKLFAAAAGGFIFTGLLLWTLVSLGLVGSLPATFMTGSGWVLPLLAGAVTGGVAWALVRGDSVERGPSCDWQATGTECAECGGSIRADWRLCPHCGHRVTTA